MAFPSEIRDIKKQHRLAENAEADSKKSGETAGRRDYFDDISVRETRDVKKLRRHDENAKADAKKVPYDR